MVCNAHDHRALPCRSSLLVMNCVTTKDNAAPNAVDYKVWSVQQRGSALCDNPVSHCFVWSDTTRGTCGHGGLSFWAFCCLLLPLVVRMQVCETDSMATDGHVETRWTLTQKERKGKQKENKNKHQQQQRKGKEKKTKGKQEQTSTTGKVRKITREENKKERN